MKPKPLNSSVALLAIAVGSCIACLPTTAEEVSYFFDFNDGVVPKALNIIAYPFADAPSGTATCEVFNGYLRIYDTVSSSSGLYFSPEESFTDTHISAIVNPDGLPPLEYCLMGARAVAADQKIHGYGCYIWRHSQQNSIGFAMYKYVNGEQVYAIGTSPLSSLSIVDWGPYLMEFDCVERKTSEGVEYTEFMARLTYDDGRKGVSFYAQDHGNLGGYDRITSGQVIFGAGMDAAQRDRSWKLDTGYDDVSITGTVSVNTTLQADLNGDGFVGSADLDIVRSNWGQAVDPGCLPCGDPSGDGFVNSADLDIVRANWGATAAASVPEPAFLALGSLAAALFLARRR